MAQGKGPSLAELKRQLDSLACNLFNIDLQIQQVKQENTNPNSLCLIRMSPILLNSATSH